MAMKSSRSDEQRQASTGDERGVRQQGPRGGDQQPGRQADQLAALVDGRAQRGLAGAGDRRAPGLLQPPVNLLRLSLHPEDLAPGIADLREWRGHPPSRLDRQIAASGDVALEALHEEPSR
ncbi:MAG: hypothetical protein ABI699_07975 [Caldimonas sp.]